MSDQLNTFLGNLHHFYKTSYTGNIKLKDLITNRTWKLVITYCGLPIGKDKNINGIACRCSFHGEETLALGSLSKVGKKHVYFKGDVWKLKVKPVGSSIYGTLRIKNEYYPIEFSYEY
jgi:hypothetical protein